MENVMSKRIDSRIISTEMGIERSVIDAYFIENNWERIVPAAAMFQIKKDFEERGLWVRTVNKRGPKCLSFPGMDGIKGNQMLSLDTATIKKLKSLVEISISEFVEMAIWEKLNKDGTK
jgi:hypothetical protein